MPIIASLLDTDLYKLTMQAVVATKYGDAIAEYTLTNRTVDKHFNDEASRWIENEILALGDLRFTNEEIEYLQRTVSFLPASYYEFLHSVKLDPASQVTVTMSPNLEITVKGPWKSTILYEIPVLAIVSEAYFKFCDTDWNYEGQKENATNKTNELLNSGCVFSEFGTRRRRSREAQRLVIEGIVEASKTNPNGAKFVGTSNVLLAKEFGLRPVGTVAHEFMMGVAAYHGDYKSANKIAMDQWLDTVGNENAGFALTDTFGTKSFLEVFVPPYTDVYRGVRQDSGDPKEYTQLIAKHYKNLGYAPNTKHILYSDSLNLELCEEYRSSALEAGLIPSFGVGTFFTNDFTTASGSGKSKPLNIVMKLHALNGKPCIKLSDNSSKNTGDPLEVARAKRAVGYSDDEAAIDEANRW